MTTQPTALHPADVSDAEIDAVSVAHWGAHEGIPLAAHRAYARAILALRPAQQATPEPRIRLTADPTDPAVQERLAAKFGEVQATPEPVALTDERIDHIADLVVKGMPEGVMGFLNSWGWRQFARLLLEDCAGHYALPPAKPEPVGEVDTGPLVLREVFALCEDTMTKMESESTEFSRGRTFEAKGISRAIGTWFQDEFCGRSHMGEPVIAPTHPAPQPVPMTDEQRKQVFRNAENRMMREINLSWRNAVVECVEAHHGITAQANGAG